MAGLVDASGSLCSGRERGGAVAGPGGVASVGAASPAIGRHCSTAAGTKCLRERSRMASRLPSPG
ncbi:MAG: hypothetical protein ACE5IM_13530, partial [Nitrospinota bacterium]